MDNSGQLQRLMQYRAAQQKQQQSQTSQESTRTMYDDLLAGKLPPHTNDFANMYKQVDDFKSRKANISYEDSRLGVSDRITKSNAMGYGIKTQDDSFTSVDTSCFMKLDKEGNPSFYRGVDASYNEVLEKTGQPTLETGNAYMQNGKPMEFQNELGDNRREMAFEPISKEDYMSLTYATEQDISSQVSRVQEMSANGKIPEGGYVPMQEQPVISDYTHSAVATQSMLNTADALSGKEFDQVTKNGTSVMEHWRSHDLQDCHYTSAQMSTPGMQRNMIKETQQVVSGMEASQSTPTQSFSYNDMLAQQLQQNMAQARKQNDDEEEKDILDVAIDAYGKALTWQLMQNQMRSQNEGIRSMPVASYSNGMDMNTFLKAELQDMQHIYDVDKSFAQRFSKLDMSSEYQPEAGMEGYAELHADASEPEAPESGTPEADSSNAEDEFSEEVSKDAESQEELDEPSKDSHEADTADVDAEASKAAHTRDVPDALKQSVADFDSNYTCDRGVPDGMSNIHAEDESMSIGMSL